MKPFDESANEELIEMVLKRRQEGWVIDKLAEPPISHPGCDDPDGKFNWYRVIDDKGKPQGVFFTPPDVEFR